MSLNWGELINFSLICPLFDFLYKYSHGDMWMIGGDQTATFWIEKDGKELPRVLKSTREIRWQGQENLGKPPQKLACPLRSDLS